MSVPSLVGALQRGMNLHEYRIERVLGHGGFGITYLAYDTLLDKLVAIKEYLPNELAARVEGQSVSIRSADSREAFDWGRSHFVKEAKVLARFAHPNLIQVHRFFELNGTAYFVMDYAEGTTLAALLKAEGPLPEERLRALLVPITHGLEQVHEKGVLHRDIKPDNILLRRDGTPVLIDFGAARQTMGGATLSVMGVVTAGYAPLEQYGTSGTQGPWTDVYALGAVAYRIVTGNKPADAVNRVGHDPVVPARTVGAGRYSDHVLSAIDWALAVSPEDRPQTVVEWREALEGIHPAPALAPASAAAVDQDGPTEIIRHAGAGVEATELIRKPVRPGAAHWKRWALPAGGSAAALAVIAMVVLIGRTPEPEPAALQAPAVEAKAGQEAESARPAGKPTAPPKKSTAAGPAPSPVRGTEPGSKPAPARGASQPRKDPEPAAPAAPKKQLAVAQLAPGAAFQDCANCPMMGVLPRGNFMMGSARKAPGAAKWEMPERRVTLKKPIAMGWFEVTVREWQLCVEARVCPGAKTGPVRGAANRAPVVHVNWTDALTYTGWLSQHTGRTYRLPTEAEWEYAIRAGTTSSRYWGDDRRGQCQHANGADLSAQKRNKTMPAGPEPCDDGFAALAPVGSFVPNAFGLYDMAGNVWEWMLDCWADSYAKASADGSAVDVAGCGRRVIRGGSWRAKPEAMRSANRGLSPADFRGEDVGFRVVAE